jgi:ATP-binding cassette subfamily F protein 3
VIRLDAIAKSFAGQRLFESLSWKLEPDERIGLVGPNGVGKTTLCRILAGLEEPDAGRVVVDRGVSVGYLPQEVGATVAGSVLAEALSGFEDVWRLERELEALGVALAADPSDALTARYGDLQHEFEARGGYELEARARVILGGLGFGPDDFHRPLAEFSGGWRMRAALARLLVLRPTLLLLDEPTNHLDLESLGWLEAFLAEYPGSVVVVSHDRYFLNRMVTSIAELTADGLALYAGGYDSFLVGREARRQLLEARARNQARRVAEIERFVERFRYQATKARQVQSRIKLLDRMERITVDRPERRIRFAFPAPPRTGRVVAQLAGVDKAYGDTVVYRGLDLVVERGDRIALVGSNGAGKSTLLRILAGVLPFEAGTRRLGAHVTVHYYAQHQLDALDPVRTVLEELEPVAPEASEARLRTILGTFLFSGDSVDKRVAVLSGGEKARLALARMLVRPAALLCLDEPTNHLDLASRGVLEQALSEFPGTMVFISHDRYFINALASKVIEIAGGALTVHLGDYDAYQARKRVPPAAPAPPAAPGTGRRSRAADAGSRGETRGNRRPAELRRRVETLEREIQTLEDRLADLAAALSDPGLYADGARVRAVTAEQRETQAQVAWLMREWEELASRVSGSD